MEKKTKWIAIVGLSVVGICLLTCVGLGAAVRFAPEIYRDSLENSSLAVGAAAPDFELISLDGDALRLSDFRGRPVLLTIGTTWCPDCVKEAPVLQDLHLEHPELVILMVDSEEPRATVQDFVERMGLTYRVLLDPDGEVLKLYQVFAIPTVLFIDDQGVIQAKIIEGVTPQLLAGKLPAIGVEP